jgi:hypothetical protein
VLKTGEDTTGDRKTVAESYADKRASMATMTNIINELLESCDSVDIQANGRGFSVTAWKNEIGNRRPVARSHRLCVGDAIGDIVKKINAG